MLKDLDITPDDPAELKAVNRLLADEVKALSSFSGGIDGRPIGEYRAENSGSRIVRAALTISRIERSG